MLLFMSNCSASEKQQNVKTKFRKQTGIFGDFYIYIHTVYMLQTADFFSYKCAFKLDKYHPAEFTL